MLELCFFFVDRQNFWCLDDAKFNNKVRKLVIDKRGSGERGPYPGGEGVLDQYWGIGVQLRV